MTYSCYFCSQSIKFRDDYEAKENGYRVVGYNLNLGERYVCCPDCRNSPKEKVDKPEVKNEHEEMIEVIK